MSRIVRSVLYLNVRLVLMVKLKRNEFQAEYIFKLDSHTDQKLRRSEGNRLLTPAIEKWRKSRQCSITTSVLGYF